MLRDLYEISVDADFLSVKWVGYKPWTKQIATKDYKHPPQPLTVAKLARHVSRALEKYFEVSTLIHISGEKINKEV